MTVTLNDLTDFTLETLRRVAWDGEAVTFGPAALERMRRRRAQFLALVEREPQTRIYGVTTGFGDKAKTLLSAEERARQAKSPAIQKSLGLGPRVPDAAVRAMILSRLINFVSGYAAVSLETAQGVAAMLDGRPLPEMRLESQDSAGELHQLFNLYHHLMGPMSGLRDQNALRNGSGCAPGLLGELALRSERRAAVASAVFALSIDAGGMGLAPYDPALKPILNDAYESQAIDRLASLLAGVETRGRRDYQAPISWRVLTRMLGQMYRVVGALSHTAEELLTTVNDNPVYLGPEEAPPHGRCITTGGFHVPRAYHAINAQAALWGDLAAIAARETQQLHRGTVTGLPDRLWQGDSRFSTFFFSAAVYDQAQRAQDAARPALIPLYTPPDEQTDIVMPLFLAWEREGAAARALDRCLAMLAASASQAMHVAGRDSAPALRPLLAEVRKVFPVVESARDLGYEAEALADLLDAATRGKGSLATL
ncbi:MAG TPA: aromatic amino acid lyase [Kiloniellales bacterium]|nr:aromatic amino acid lyase [Kiloniellales bacterium]